MFQKLLVGLLILSPLAAYPFLRDSGNSNTEWKIGPDELPPGAVLTGSQQLASSKVGLEDLAAKDPIAFLDRCLERYEREVRGYRFTFLKQERVNGKLRPKEIVKVHFREKPFSVHMNWIEGRGKAVRTLYVEGENDGNLLARPFITLLPVQSVKPDGVEAMATSRFPITESGMKKGMINTVDAFRDAQKKGSLHVRYEGIQPLREVGNRMCYKFVRSPYESKDWQTDLDKEERLNELIIYIDRETLLQVGSVLKDVEGNLIAEYYFRDVELNPTFDENQFTDKAL